jgi:hypothetical protein
MGNMTSPCKGIRNCASVTANPNDGPPLIEIGLTFGHDFVDQAIVSSRNAGQSLAGHAARQGRSPSAGLVSLHQRETQRLLCQMLFGQAMRAGTGRAEVDGAETFVNTVRLQATNLDDRASRRSLAGSWIELET